MSSHSRSPVGPAQYVLLLLPPHFKLPQTTQGSAITCSYFIPTFLQQRQDSPCRHWEGTACREAACGSCPCSSTPCVGRSCESAHGKRFLKAAAEELVKQKWAVGWCMTRQEAETLFELVSNLFCNAHQTRIPDPQPVWDTGAWYRSGLNFPRSVISCGMTIKIILL